MTPRRPDHLNGIPRIVTWPGRHPVAAIVLALLAVLLSGYSLTRLRTDTRLESLFDPDAPTTAALRSVMNDFHGSDELLLLVTAPEGGKSAGDESRRAARLTAFAQRLQSAIAEDPAAAAMVRSVTYAADESTRRFVEEVIVPAGALYLDDQAFAQLEARLSQAGMRKQIERNEELISVPVGATGPLAKIILKDPLHLHELLVARLDEMRPPLHTWRDGEAFLSSDARSLLIRIVAAKPASDSDFTAALMASAPRWAAAAETGDLELGWSGAYAMADHSRTEIRGDLISCITGSVILIQVLFLLAYRRLGWFILAFAPVAVGVLVGFGIFALFRDRVTPITAAIGGILAGMGIDYPIHYLSHHDAMRSREPSPAMPGGAGGGLLLALLAACGTSVAAFGAIAISDVPLLRNFALLGALGLAGAFIATLVVLPALLSLADRPRDGAGPMNQRFSLRRLVIWLDGHRVIAAPLAAIGLLAIIVVTLTRRDPWLESDPAVMHPQPNPALITQDRITQMFSGMPESLIIYMHAESPAGLSRTMHDVHQRLRSPAMGDLVAGVLSPATFLPHPEVAMARLHALNQIDPERVIADFRAALQDSPFSPEAYSEYELFLRRLLRPDHVPDIATLKRYPGVASSLLPIVAFEPGAPPPTQAVAIAFLRHDLADRVKRDAAITRLQAALADIGNIPGPGTGSGAEAGRATLTGLSVAGYEMERGVRQDLPKMIAVGLGLVVIWVIACLRNWRLALLASIPVVFGAACLLAVMRLADLKLNMVNMLALPILAGTAVDAGIFLTGLAVPYMRGLISREIWLEQMSASLRAIVLCTLTTMIGFGSLMAASTPAVASLGLLLPIGMAAALAGCMFLLVPLLLRLTPDAGPRTGERKEP